MSWDRTWKCRNRRITLQEFSSAVEAVVTEYQGVTGRVEKESDDCWTCFSTLTRPGCTAFARASRAGITATIAAVRTVTTTNRAAVIAVCPDDTQINATNYANNGCSYHEACKVIETSRVMLKPRLVDQIFFVVVSSKHHKCDTDDNCLCEQKHTPNVPNQQ